MPERPARCAGPACSIRPTLAVGLLFVPPSVNALRHRISWQYKSDSSAGIKSNELSAPKFRFLRLSRISVNTAPFRMPSSCRAQQMKSRSVADVEGPWVEPDFNSSLIERCRANWSVPVSEISNYVLATFIRQRKALSLVVPEARRRIGAGFTDETELYDEELSVAVLEADSNR